MISAARKLISKSHRCNPSTGCETERGAVLVWLALILSTMIVVLGLGVDSAQMQWAALQVQKASDQACFEAMSYRAKIGRWNILGKDAAGISNFWTAIYNIVRVMERGRQGALNSLEKSGFDTTLTGTNLSDTSGMVYDTTNESFTATVTAARRLYVMDWVPFVSGAPRTITRNTTCALDPAVVAMMVDLSGSSKCPSSGSCDCMYTNSCPTTDRKLDNYKTAATSFVNQFNETRDQLALIPFATIATVAVNFQATGFPITTVVDRINRFNLGAGTPNANYFQIAEGYNTNLTDAFIRTYEAVREGLITNILSPNKRINYVLLSDSAPTAATFYFANPKPSLSANATNASNHSAVYSPAGLSNFSHHFVHWDLTYMEDLPPSEWDTMWSAPPALAYPQRLAPTGTWDDWFRWYDIVNGEEFWDANPRKTNNAADSVAATCASNRGGERPWVNAGSYYGNFSDTLGACLNSMSFRGPNGTAYSGAWQHIDGWNDNYQKFYQYQKDYYNSAIVWADALRTVNNSGAGTWFYVVGIGDEAPIVSGDPYQMCENCFYPNRDPRVNNQVCNFCHASDASQVLATGDPSLLISGAVGQTRGAACTAYLTAHPHAVACPQETVRGDVSQSKKRKDVLLTRIAGDTLKKTALGSNATIGSGSDHPDFCTGNTYFSNCPAFPATQTGNVMFGTKYDEMNGFLKSISDDLFRVTD